MDDDGPEVCDECGFDSRRWRVRDARDHLASLGWWWREALNEIDQADALRRPRPAVWSPIEYGAHSALVTAMLRTAIEEVVAADGWEAPPLGPMAHAAEPDTPLALPLTSV